MSNNLNTTDYTFSAVMERFARFVCTVFKYIELAIALALIGTLFLIVTVLNALF